MKKDLDCYRVRLRRGDQLRSPLIAASSPEEAFEKAKVLAHQMFGGDFPWQAAEGRHRPRPDKPNQLISISEPVLEHNGHR